MQQHVQSLESQVGMILQAERRGEATVEILAKQGGVVLPPVGGPGSPPAGAGAAGVGAGAVGEKAGYLNRMFRLRTPADV